MRYLSILTILIAVLLPNVSISFSGNGSGTEEDPYQITNVHQLQEMNDDLDAHYILMNDIDASETRQWNNGTGFEPVGEYLDGSPLVGFTGTLNGQNNTVQNLYIYRSKENAVGLFGCIADGGNILDVNIETDLVYGYTEVGGLAGRVYAFSLESEVVIDNCNLKVNIFGTDCVAAFCSCVISINGSVTISNSTTSGMVEGLAYDIAGFCGYNGAENGEINYINCGSYSNVICKTNTGKFSGGFSGINYSITGSIYINNCFSMGSVESYEIIGGFCGKNESANGSILITNCFSKGNVIGRKDRIGGFTGAIAASDSNVKIQNSYSIGSVSGKKFTGGFCGLNENPNDGQIISCYYDTQTSGTTESSGGTGKTTAEMMMQSTFVDWDFDEVWCMGEHETYPQLQHFVDCDTLVSVEEENHRDEIEIYPNPATEKITVSSNSIIGERIEIYNILGMKLWQGVAENNNHDINISNLPLNVYLLKLKSKTFIFVKK